jgi:DNA-binding HxlR family transcriptional regulator
MDKNDLRFMLYVLGKEHSLDIIINLYKNGWQTASEVARDLGIHIATAVKYLSELHELGLVTRQEKKGRTRTTFEYKYRKQVISIEFELNNLQKEPPRPEYKPLVLFAILYTIFVKSRKVIGPTVDALVNLRFKKLRNGEKKLVMDSLMAKSDLEDAKDLFLKNLNGRALTEERCRDVVNALTEIIDCVVAHYEIRLGYHSTVSLVDVTMEKVINVVGKDLTGTSGVLDSLSNHYFEKWIA